MASFTDTVVARSRLAFGWWARELLGLFPVSVRDAFRQEPDDLTLYYNDGRLHVVRPERRPGAAQSEHLASDARSWPIFAGTPDGSVPGAATVWLPYSDCLERHFTVPAAAAQDLERVVQLELERATPFRTADVFSCYLTSPSPENHAVLSVRHFIAKRDAISAVQSRLQNEGIEARTITCLDKNGRRPLPINFLAGKGGAYDRKRRLIPTLAAVALVLVATATAIAVVRSERALAVLDARTAQARSEWQDRQNSTKPTLAKLDEANAIAALKLKHVPSVFLLNEVTRLLPDDVHLSDFTLSNGTIVISGLGRDTSRLIPLLAGSGMFTDVQLAAAVTTDPATDKERFSIRFALRSNTATPSHPDTEEPL